MTLWTPRGLETLGKIILEGESYWGSWREFGRQTDVAPSTLRQLSHHANGKGNTDPAAATINNLHLKIPIPLTGDSPLFFMSSDLVAIGSGRQRVRFTEEDPPFLFSQVIQARADELELDIEALAEEIIVDVETMRRLLLFGGWPQGIQLEGPEMAQFLRLGTWHSDIENFAELTRSPMAPETDEDAKDDGGESGNRSRNGKFICI